MKADRVEKLQAMLFNEWRYLNNDNRELPIEWNVMHMYTSSQLAKLVAVKRGIDPELAAITAVLHDIAVVATSSTDDHGAKAGPFIRDAISRFNISVPAELQIQNDEIEQIILAVKVHSDKDTHSDNELAELLKDVDCVDRYLHGVKTEGNYLKRCRNVLRELSLLEDPAMRIEHVALWTKDIEKLKKFYVDYFGGSAREKYTNLEKSFESYFITFDSGTRLELMQMPAIPENLNDMSRQYIGLIHIAISAGSAIKVDSITNELRNLGYTVVSEPRYTGDGYYESCILDPDGNRVEITL